MLLHFSPFYFQYFGTLPKFNFNTTGNIYLAPESDLTIHSFSEKSRLDPVASALFPVAGSNFTSLLELVEVKDTQYVHVDMLYGCVYIFPSPLF